MSILLFVNCTLLFILYLTLVLKFYIMPIQSYWLTNYSDYISRAIKVIQYADTIAELKKDMDSEREVTRWSKGA